MPSCPNLKLFPFPSPLTPYQKLMNARMSNNLFQNYKVLNMGIPPILKLVKLVYLQGYAVQKEVVSIETLKNEIK